MSVANEKMPLIFLIVVNVIMIMLFKLTLFILDDV